MFNERALRSRGTVPQIEAPCSPALAGQGIFDPQGSTMYSNRALIPQHAAGKLLAPGFTLTGVTIPIRIFLYFFINWSSADLIFFASSTAPGEASKGDLPSRPDLTVSGV